jgi:hypothetical protein
MFKNESKTFFRANLSKQFIKIKGDILNLFGENQGLPNLF